MKYSGDYKWEDVAVLDFKSITRQVLFDGLGDLPCQLRYFEVQTGGYSSLERHHHVHFVMILRGAGQVFLGNHIYSVTEKDVITIPSQTWHQFRANAESPLGFLCLVNVERDKVQLPTGDDLIELRKDSKIAAFIKS
jgi:quercetin dioxygenase-like cupin family protein